MSRNNKHAQISAMHLLRVEDAEVENHPGNDIIRISGEWHNTNISSIEFSEDDSRPGMPVAVELSAEITDTSNDSRLLYRGYAITPLLIRLDYTNGESRVIGTDTAPIYLGISVKGSPAVINVYYKGVSPESSKLLQSF